MYGYAHTVHLVISKPKIPYVHRMCRVGQNRIYTPYMTVHLVIFLPKILYTHRIYMVLANPTYVHRVSLILANPTNNAWDHEHRRSHDTQSQNTAGHTIHNHRTQQVTRYTITEHSRSHDTQSQNTAGHTIRSYNQITTRVSLTCGACFHQRPALMNTRTLASAHCTTPGTVFLS